jgi:hypothetical protein
VQLIGHYVLAALSTSGNAFNGHVLLPTAIGVVVLPLSEDGQCEKHAGDLTSGRIDDRPPECAPLTAVERRAWARIMADLT